MNNLSGQQLGNYHLVRLLGQGGFADVYLGEHVFLKTHAAIKVLHTLRPFAVAMAGPGEFAPYKD